MTRTDPPPPPSAFDRLREAFQAPESFKSVTSGPPSPGPPAESLFASPRAPGRVRIDPGASGLRVLLLVGLAAALLAGGYAWWSRPEPRPVPQAAVDRVPRPAVPVAISTPAPTPTPSTVVVDVTGKVRHPGVVDLPAGARVIDAIKAAGGFRPGAGPGTLNLARRVTDGEQIFVGIDPPSPPPVAAPSALPSGSGAPGAPVDLNTASAAEFDRLPGVGPVLAQRIVDYRAQHGAFRSVDELRQVSGIGPAKFADLKSLVKV